MDVKTAFFHGDIEEELYMKLLVGLQLHGFCYSDIADDESQNIVALSHYYRGDEAIDQMAMTYAQDISYELPYHTMARMRFLCIHIGRPDIKSILRHV